MNDPQIFAAMDIKNLDPFYDSHPKSILVEHSKLIKGSTPDSKHGVRAVLVGSTMAGEKVVRLDF